MVSPQIPYYEEQVDALGVALLLATQGRRTEEEDQKLKEAVVRYVGQPRLRAVARKNKVEALIGRALLDVLGAQSVDPAWREQVDANEARVEGLLRALEEVVTTLEKGGCRSAVIEGGGTLLATASPLAAYGSGDFDLLVDDAHWNSTPDLLARLGFSARDRRGRPTERVEYHRRVGGADQWIEIGSRPFDRMWVPLGFQDRAQMWLERRVPVTTHPKLHVLEPSDAVALCALHASMHSYVRSPGLRLYVDMDRLVREERVDWAHVVREVDLMGVRTRAFVALCMVRSLLSTPVPDDALRALFPGGTRWSLLHRLIAQEGVVANGRRKLTGARAMALDALIHDDGPASWLRSAFLPPEAWLRERFDRDRTHGWGRTRLHLERFRLLATQWRKEVG